jgi:hypothetical protein
MSARGAIGGKMAKKPRRRSSTAKVKKQAAGVVVAFPTLKPPASEPSRELRNWFRFRLRNGFVGAVPVVDNDMARLWRKIQTPDDFHMFAVFETPHRIIALNMRHLVACQFDGHPAHGLRGEFLPVEDGIDVMFSDSAQLLHIDLWPDEMTLHDVDHKEKAAGLDETETAEMIQLASLLFYCESSHEGSDYMERVQDHFYSSIWLRLNDVAVISIPVDFVIPDE